jgi:hypothetical protein
MVSNQDGIEPDVRVSLPVVMIRFVVPGQEGEALGQPNDPGISTRGESKIHDPLIQPTTHHEEEDRTPVVPELAGCHLPGDGQRPLGEEDIHTDFPPPDLTHQVPHREDGCDHQGKGLLRFDLLPGLTAEEREEE